LPLKYSKGKQEQSKTRYFKVYYNHPTRCSCAQSILFHCSIKNWLCTAASCWIIV